MAASAPSTRSASSSSVSRPSPAAARRTFDRALPLGVGRAQRAGWLRVRGHDLRCIKDLRVAVSTRAAAFACLGGRDRAEDNSSRCPRGRGARRRLRGVPGAHRRGGSRDDRQGASSTRWSAGDDAAAARLTDDPKAAAAVLKANRRGLDGASLKATLGELKESGRRRHGEAVAAAGRSRGSAAGATTRRSACARSEEEWRVRWSPTMVHPKLDDETRLGTTAVPKARGEILDRDRRPLMRERAVVRVGAIAGKVKRPAVTARGLAEVLDVDGRARWSARSAAAASSSSSTRSPCARPTTAACAPRIEAVPDAATAESHRHARAEPRVRPRAARDRRPGHQGAAREARRAASGRARPSGSGACRRASSGGSRPCPSGGW